MARRSLFPPYNLDEALLIARTIWENNAGKPMRRLSLFDVLGKSPSSGPSRQLITASVGYGLTQGGYRAETIKLADRGRAIVERNDAQARLDAVLNVEAFRAFFEHYRDAAIPSEISAIDFLKEQGISEKSAPSCLEVLLESGEQVALIQEISGAKHVVSPEHALEELLKSSGVTVTPEPQERKGEKKPSVKAAPSTVSAGKAKRLPSLNINIQIHLPVDAKPETYEVIFKNIREHLMDEE